MPTLDLAEALQFASVIRHQFLPAGSARLTAPGFIGAPRSGLDGQQPRDLHGVPTAPTYRGPHATSPLLTTIPVFRSNVSICVMPITALAGAVPHSGWAVGASVRDLTTRWHGKEQRVAVPNLIQLRRRLAAHLGVVVVLPASWRGLVGPIAARHATATRARKCDHVCRPGLLPLRALQRHSRDCIG